MYVMNRSSSVAFDPIPSDLRDLVYELWDRHASAQFPLAYLITFTCYGTRLHGDPRGLLNSFKAYSTRGLNRAFGRWPENKWAEKGSKRYLWKPENVLERIRYVLFLQGEPMETYFATEQEFR